MSTVWYLPNTRAAFAVMSRTDAPPILLGSFTNSYGSTPMLTSFSSAARKPVKVGFGRLELKDWKSSPGSSAMSLPPICEERLSKEALVLAPSSKAMSPSTVPPAFLMTRVTSELSFTAIFSRASISISSWMELMLCWSMGTPRAPLAYSWSTTCIMAFARIWRLEPSDLMTL